MTNQNWNTNAPQDPPSYGQTPAGSDSTPSYQPPANTTPNEAPAGGYTPPAGSAPGGYTPPAGGGYTPPAGGGYAPPAGGYSQPAGGYGAPAAEPNFNAPAQNYGAPNPYGQSNYPAPGSYNQPYPTGPTATLADWPKRALGGLIDYVVPSIVYSIVSSPFQGTLDPTTGRTIGGNGFITFILWLLYMGFVAYNSWYLGGNTGYSIGRRVAKVKLVSEADGKPIGMLRAFLRHLAHFIDGIICAIGWLFPLWDPKKQTIADKIMKTVVINGDGQN